MSANRARPEVRARVQRGAIGRNRHPLEVGLHAISHSPVGGGNRSGGGCTRGADASRISRRLRERGG
jgi:hypothetical protein